MKRIVCVALSILCSTMGCSPGAGLPGGSLPGGGRAGEGPFGPPKKVALLDPFQGHWKCDREKTYALWKKQGKQAAVEAQQTAEAELRASPQAKDLVGMIKFPHPDITITGNVIRGDGLLGGEYDLFALHQHDQVVCGKAWHHEDPGDPGDMSKAWVRLELVDYELHLHVKMGDSPDLSDPDITTMPLLADANTCKTAGEKVTSEDWSTYVFLRSAKP